MVECVRPEPMKTVADPCCGSGGFLLAAQSYLADPQHYNLDREAKEFLKKEAFRGWEIVPTTFKMSLMNLYLHNIGDLYGQVPITLGDALLTDPGERFDYVLTNPPFGKKSALTFTNEEGEQEEEDLVYNRQDFWTTSSNKQLNFLQHIMTILDINGRAAVVLPDNVLFEGGAGETLRRRLLTDFDLHTLLRLPTGLFYAQGVKANVLFFDKKPASEAPWSSKLWVYDLRTSQHFTLKRNPLTRAHLDDFVDSYAPGKPRDERAESDLFKSYTYDELIARDKVNLDIKWLREESFENLDQLPAPEVIAREIVEDLTAALEEFAAVAAELEDASVPSEQRVD